LDIIDYLDKKKATIAILKDWRDQNWKKDYNRERILEISEQMMRTTSSNGKEPVKGGRSTQEERLINGISRKDVLEKGYKDAVHYINEVSPCWDRLTEEERYMLTARYIDYDERNGIEKIMKRFYISRTAAYNRSFAALERLSKLIFW
jgi:hypothetical protein